MTYEFLVINISLFWFVILIGFPGVEVLIAHNQNL